MFFLGIDVSKAKLNGALLGAEGDKRKAKVVHNTAAGIQALVAWCAKQGVAPGQLHVVLEPTGPYHEQAGTALHDRSEERCVGKEGVSTCRSRGWEGHTKKKEKKARTS